MRRLALVGILLLVAAGPASGQGNTDPALDKLAAAFAAAFNAKDAAGIAAFYTEDGVVMAPNMPMVRGRRDIEAYYKQGFSQVGGTIRLQPFESASSGTVAFEAGRSTLTAGNPSGQLVPGGGSGGRTQGGKYLVLYKRVKDEWKIAFDIFNNNE